MVDNMHHSASHQMGSTYCFLDFAPRLSRMPSIIPLQLYILLSNKYLPPESYMASSPHAFYNTLILVQEFTSSCFFLVTVLQASLCNLHQSRHKSTLVQQPQQTAGGDDFLILPLGKLQSAVYQKVKLYSNCIAVSWLVCFCHWLKNS